MLVQPEPPAIYTVITFAPVQGFISSSRKLRDLYGSSLLLSYLARAIVLDATSRLGADAVITPAGVKAARGTPNTLVIIGDYRRGHGRLALEQAWAGILEACRAWLENVLKRRLPQFPCEWESSWQQERSHAWEFFHGQGSTLGEARQALAITKTQRDWTGINWTGESSTLSGSGAVCRPSMGRVIDPRKVSAAQIREEATAFVNVLRQELGEAFARPGRGNESPGDGEEAGHLCAHRQGGVPWGGDLRSASGEVRADR